VKVFIILRKLGTPIARSAEGDYEAILWPSGVSKLQGTDLILSSETLFISLSFKDIDSRIGSIFSDIQSL
jgi:hypothetical protein